MYSSLLPQLCKEVYGRLGYLALGGEGKTLNSKPEECNSQNLFHSGTPFFCYQLIQKNVAGSTWNLHHYKQIICVSHLLSFTWFIVCHHCHYTDIIILWRCPWCNGYRRRIWTWRHEFKSWTRLIAFHIALIPLGKVWIQIFSLQLWVNSRAD